MFKSTGSLNLLNQDSRMETKVTAPQRKSVSNLSFRSLRYQTLNSKKSNLTEQFRNFHRKVPLSGKYIQIYRRGQHIYFEGDHSKALYFINSGSIKSYLTTECGKEQVFGFHFPCDVVGFDGDEKEVHQSSAIALETTSISSFAFSQLSDSDRARYYPKLLSNQITHDYKLLIMITRKNVNCRMASFLCEIARRFEMNGYSSSEFNLSMSRYDIGNYLGLAVETVSRSLAWLQENGVIDVKVRSIIINEPEKLRQISDAIS